MYFLCAHQLRIGPLLPRGCSDHRALATLKPTSLASLRSWLARQLWLWHISRAGPWASSSSFGSTLSGAARAAKPGLAGLNASMVLPMLKKELQSGWADVGAVGGLDLRDGVAVEGCQYLQCLLISPRFPRVPGRRHREVRRWQDRVAMSPRPQCRSLR